MPKTGPQTYPGASKAYWYQDTYGGDSMEVNVVVLHTTEGSTLPSYSGGAVAPNLTALPDFANRVLRWYQHFDIETSSRALVNLSGGVETNTLNVCQVELVGTCDPATHSRWGNTPHVYWPEAPDWALQGVADFLKWMNLNHGVPLSGPAAWPPYPSSYGTNNGARMSGAQWNGFKGVCGHMHVPENLHGDPGALDFARITAMAKGVDDMALSTEDKTWLTALVKNEVAKAVWTYPLASPTAPPESNLRSAGTFLRYGDQHYAEVIAQAKANGAALTEIKTLLDGLDLDSLPAALAAKLATIRLKLEEQA